MRVKAFFWLLLSTGAQAQEQIGGFTLANRRIIWQAIIEKPGCSVDSLNDLIISRTDVDVSMKLVSRFADELTFEVDNKEFDPAWHLFSGRLQFELKPDRYRVTFTTIQWMLGARGQKQSWLWLGSEAPPLTKQSLESLALDKTQTEIRKPWRRNLTELDFIFTTAFDYMPAVAGSDW